jgi:hypothetical protein
MSIGIGITTRNRPECLRLALEHFAYFGAGDEIVVIDDNSENPTEYKNVVSESKTPILYKRSPERLGVAKAKNACLAMLKNHDHIFLFDDDAWPHKHGWAEYFINASNHNSVGHSMWMMEVPPVVTIKSKIGSGETEIHEFTNCLGVALYFSRQCLDAIGGYDHSAKNVYGYEHAQISARAKIAGFTNEYSYVTPAMASSYVYSVDISYNWYGMMPKIMPKSTTIEGLHKQGASVTKDEVELHHLNSVLMSSPSTKIDLVDPLEHVDAEIYGIKKPRVVVICPANFVSGGPEALHQLVDMINTVSPSTGYICYTPFESTHLKNKTYENYNTPILEFKDILTEDVIVIPEIYPHMVAQFANRVVFWWLSVDHFVASDPMIVSSTFLHAAQSEYAKKHIDAVYKRKAIMLSDYTNGVFLNQTGDKRIRRILTNPKKGKHLIDQFSSLHPEFKIIQIDNMERDEVSSLFLESMLFIDFGHQPGKDRMPREAALSGCVVMTTNLGAGGNESDIAIDSFYKFSEINGLAEKVNQIFDNWDFHFNAQNRYREILIVEKNTFKEEVLNFLYTIKESNGYHG